MGQVSDQLGSMANKQNATLVGIGLLLVAVVASGGAFNSIMPGSDDGDSGENGEFDMLDFNEYPVDVELKSDALGSSDTVYVVAADAESTDGNYGDRTVDPSKISFKDTEATSITEDADTGEFVISADSIGENEEFQAGQEVRVYTKDGSYTTYDTVTLPSEIEKFKFQEDQTESLSVDVLQDASFSPDGTTTSSDGDDHTYEQVMEVTDGTAVMGDVDVSNVGANVTEVSVTVTADGEQVYSESSDGSGDESISTVLSADLVEEDMNSNPVTAEDSVTVSVEVSADGTNNGVQVDLNQLNGDGQAVTSITAP